MLRQFVSKCPAWKGLDPAQDACAIERWRLITYDIEIEELWQTHSDVAPVFRNGRHAGQSVADLTRKLLQGQVRPSHLPPLVAVRVDRQLLCVDVICYMPFIEAVILRNTK